MLPSYVAFTFDGDATVTWPKLLSLCSHFVACSNLSFDFITSVTGETFPLADVGCPIFTVKLQCCNSTSAGQLQCISTDPCVFNYEVLEQEEP